MNTITMRMAEINTSPKEQHHDTANKKSHSPLTKIYPLCIAVLTAIIHFSVFQSTQAQDFWEEIPSPNNISIYSLAVDNSQNIFVGTGSGVLRTEDNGQNWEYIGINETVYSILAIEEGILYAGTSYFPGYAGIYQTTDNGDSWTPIWIDSEVYGNVISIDVWGDTIFATI